MDDSQKDKPASWNIPPKKERGEVPWSDRQIIRRGLQTQDMWVARSSEPREKELIDMLHETCKEMGIKKIPKLLIYDSEIPNAYSNLYSVGGSLGFSTNLLDIMSPKEIKAIMGHELTHYRNRRRDLAVIYGIMAATDATVALIAGGVDGHHHVAGTQITYTEVDYAALPVWYTAQQTASRWRETGADMGSAKYLGPEPMQDALRTLQKRGQEIQKERGATEKSTHKTPAIWLSHPPTDKRIKDLQKRFTSPDEADTPSTPKR